MDATPHLRALDERDASEAVGVGRLVEASQVRRSGSSNRYVAEALPAYLEFRLTDDGGREPLAFCLPTGGAPERPLEIWWADDGRWSESRSIRWRPDPSPSPRSWAIPLDRLPHWEPATDRRVRVLIRSKGPIAIGAPRLLR